MLLDNAERLLLVGINGLLREIQQDSSRRKEPAQRKEEEGRVTVSGTVPRPALHCTAAPCSLSASNVLVLELI